MPFTVHNTNKYLSKFRVPFMMTDSLNLSTPKSNIGNSLVAGDMNVCWFITENKLCPSHTKTNAGKSE